MRPQSRKTDLDTRQKLGFGSVLPKKHGFDFGFKTDPECSRQLLFFALDVVFC